MADREGKPVTPEALPSPILQRRPQENDFESWIRQGGWWRWWKDRKGPKTTVTPPKKFLEDPPGVSHRRGVGALTLRTENAFQYLALYKNSKFL